MTNVDLSTGNRARDTILMKLETFELVCLIESYFKLVWWRKGTKNVLSLVHSQLSAKDIKENNIFAS